MTRRGLALVVGALVLLHAPSVSAEPILKPHKYHGPIPQNTFSLRVGVFGGASNEEMIDFLDGRLQAPFTATTEDFGSSLTLEAGYTHKPHPHFGVRFNAALSLLSSEGSGVFVPQVPNLPDTVLLPELKYHREFKVELITVEASGIYYFADAAVAEFQTYLGGGFSVGFPHETLTETRVDSDTGQPYTDEIPGLPSEASEWDVSAGVHMVGGLLYYFSPRWGISAEGKVQLMQGRFDQIEVWDEEINQFENVNFVVDYTGFYLSVGVTYGF